MVRCRLRGLRDAGVSVEECVEHVVGELVVVNFVKQKICKRKSWRIGNDTIDYTLKQYYSIAGKAA